MEEKGRDENKLAGAGGVSNTLLTSGEQNLGTGAVMLHSCLGEVPKDILIRNKKCLMHPCPL